jgi:TonB family protein
MISRFFPSLILVLASVSGFAQSSSPKAAQSGTGAAVAAVAAPVPAIPKDPKNLMLQAARVNGLSGNDMKPWRLKANYQTFDADGKPKDKGVFEEWWVGPEKWKVSYTSPHFSQTLYRNGKTRLVTGDKGWVALPERMVMGYLDDPMPSEAVLRNRTFSIVETKIGAVSLTCLRPMPAPRAITLPTSCLDGKSAAVRLQSNHGGLYIQFNNIVLADGHYVARQISIENSNLPIVNIDVIFLDFSSKLTDADVAAPASARVAPHVAGEAGLTGGRRAQAIYTPRPATTRDDRGMVMLEVTITKSGDLRDVHVVSGPREFRDTAVRNIRSWKFTPYLLNGKPVEVRGGIDMLYGTMPVRGILLY